MIQFNLLPDVKLEYLKARRTSRMVMLVAVAITAVAVFIFVLLFLVVNVFQKQHLGNLNQDITEKTQQLKSIPDLDKVLTVQNQLSQLTGLHDQKPAASRLYSYLIQLTPNEAKVSKVDVDFAANTISLSGTANDLTTINKFVDIVKFTDYKTGETQEKAFSEVVLSSFGITEANARGGAKSSYTLNLKYNPAIFDITKEVNLIVPNIVSTRSVTEKPSELFEAQPQEPVVP